MLGNAYRLLLGLSCLVLGLTGLTSLLLVNLVDLPKPLSLDISLVLTGLGSILAGLSWLGYDRARILLWLLLAAIGLLSMLPASTPVFAWAPLALPVLGLTLWLGPGKTEQRLARLIGVLMLPVGLAILLLLWLRPPSSIAPHFQLPLLSGLLPAALGLLLAMPSMRSQAVNNQYLGRLAMLFGIGGILISVSGWTLLGWQEEHHIDHQANQVIDQTWSNLEHRLEEFRRLIGRQAARWETMGGLPDESLRTQEVTSYLGDFPRLVLLAVLDDSLQILWEEHAAHSSVISSHDVLTSSSHRDWLASLQAIGESRFSPVLSSEDGKAHLMIAYPLTLPGTTGHLLLAGLDLSAILSAQLAHTAPLVLHLHQGETHLYPKAEHQSWQHGQIVLEHSVSLSGGEAWHLEVILPPAPLLKATLSPYLILIGGLLFSYLLMVSQGLIRLSQQRRDLLDRSHQELKSALSERDQFYTLSSDLFCRVDLSGCFIQVNPAFQRLLGYLPEQLVGHPYKTLISPQDQAVIASAIDRLASGESIQRLEVQLLDNRGRTHWVEINANLGEERVIYVVAREITQRKQNEAQLLHHQHLFQIVGRTALIGAWYVERGHAPIWSDEICALHEMPRGFQPTLGQAIGFYCPSSRERIREDFGTCMRDGTPFDNEYELLTAKGRHLWVRVIGEAIRDEQGEIHRVQGSTQDITEYRRLQQEVVSLAERLTTTLESITDGFFTLDTEWRFTYLNREAERTLGCSRHRLIGQTIWTAFPEAQGSDFEMEYRHAHETQSAVHFETYFPPLALWCEVHAYPSEEGLAVYFRDINQRKAHEQQLHLLERGIESTLNGVVIADARQPDLPIVYVNAAFERVTGYLRDEVLGSNCRFLQGEHTAPDAVNEIRQGLSQSRDVHVTLCNYRKDGTPFWNDLYLSPVRDETGNVSHFIGVQNDISTQREYESRLAYNANHDALTGLPNRWLLEDRLAQDCLFASRHNLLQGVLFIDLDGFKPINDTLGHSLGDRILIEVAQRLLAAVRPGDTVARFGSDEFVILLPELESEENALPLIEALLVSLSRPYRLADSELRLTASIGIATERGAIPDPMRLIQQADLAMYKAKRLGRNTYYWYTEDLNHKVSERVRLRSDLQQAIDEQQFELHYQPQIHGPSGTVIGFEALIRWRHPLHGFVSPADFIPLAEDTGQIIPISDWVLATACRDNRYLNALGLGEFRMGVNVSPMQFHRRQFVEGILHTLDDSALPPHLLELELTEGILMEKADYAIETLHSLRQAGISIAIDDFGTGFSSLSYLKYLPVDKIKIDRSFIQEVISDHRDAAIIQGVLSMATPLQLQVVAEGVETQAQYSYLRKHLCDLYQGYHFARPMPLADLETFLREHHAARHLDEARQNGDTDRQTLLLLDDEPNILNALNRTLRRDGYRILTASAPQEAFELLATHEVQVIISDQRMPAMSGTEFLHRVKDLYPQAIQIVLSGYTDLKTVTTAINEGAIYKFLTKPWDDDELRLVVQRAFREAAVIQVRHRTQVASRH